MSVTPDRTRDRERLLPMVGWYDPPVLAQTGLLLTLANIFGRRSDTRLIEALAGEPQGIFDYSDAQGEFWLDYVSDIGDGWNSAYAVARAIAERELVVSGAGGASERLRAGEVLVFGGDAVYPYPSRLAYELRTEKPYATAFAGRSGPRPDLFAVPGNHDWYDSLVAFTRMFCRPERPFAGCRTQQTRSYFALRLPRRWWLLGIDLQLGADLDEPQVRYFQRVAAAMQPDARVILCVPEPQWILRESYPEVASYGGEALEFLQKQVLARPVELFLTGDLHYYRRHASGEGVQKIVSGGGGAFLHPTHERKLEELEGGFHEQACYPDPRTSSRLAWRNFLFPFINPRFMFASALLYAMTAWFASASFIEADAESAASALHAALIASVRDPVNGLWLLAFVAGFIFFTDTHKTWYRVGGGAAHALAHLGAAFLCGWLALVATTRWLGLAFGSMPQMLTAAAITLPLGGVVGALILGSYLFMSLQLFGRHAAEAFSSLRIEDFKNWVRLRIDASGRLSLFAIGIDRVPRRWTARTVDGAGATLVPEDARATAPRLIDRLDLA